MQMRSHIRSATPMSCVLKTMVVPWRRTSRIGVLEDLGVHRVQPGERFVQDQQLWSRDQRRNELDLLRHALGKGFDGLVEPGGEPDLVNPPINLDVYFFERFALEADRSSRSRRRTFIFL